MGPRTAKEKSSDQKPKKFYKVGYRHGEKRSGRVYLNQEEVCRSSGETLMRTPSRFQRGFRDYAVRPKFRVGKRFGKAPHDVEPYGEYWLVSDRAKQLFDAVAKTDFAYLAVDTETDRDTEPVTYWFCDIVSVLDAVDEARSVVQSHILKDGSKLHDAAYGSLAFDEAIVGQHCIFRMRTSLSTMICNERFKTEVKQEGLTGLSFWEAFEPPFDKVGTVTALPPPFGTIKPEGRGAEISFYQKQLEALGAPLKLGQTVRAQGRRNRYGYSATHLEII